MKSMICASALMLAFAAATTAGEAPTMSGAQLYQEFCATCHGRSAHGDGPVARTLKQQVPDLTLIAKRRGGVFPREVIHQFIDGRSMPRAHGTSEMPVWGWEFYGYEGEDATRRRRVAELIDQLVEYLESIQDHAR
ncbi:MAG TPA: c-type cytochrome [Steroidobacteraceae bacterium]|nr:c-type cytochrome [Steroidobacteraceae bacterium]